MNGSEKRTVPEASGELEMADRSRFESLMIEITSRFANVRMGEVDAAIQEAQRLLCESLGLDRSALFQYSEGEAGPLLRTHVYQRSDLALSLGEDAVAGREMDVRLQFPWLYEQIQRGETVVIPAATLLPPAAALDQRNLVKYGVQSLVAVPIKAGGVKLGLLTFLSISRQRAWTEDLVKRLQSVANVFATWLAGKRAETDRNLSETHYRSIFDAASDAIVLLDCETGQVLDANAATLKMYGYSRGEILQLRDLDLAAEPETKSIISRSDPVPVQWHRRKSGETFPVELSFSFLKGRERAACVAVIRDITERERAQRRLENSEQRFREIAENIREVFYVFNRRTRALEYVSPAYEQIWGRSCQSLYEHPKSFFDAVHPEDRERVKQAKAALDEGKVMDVEYRVITSEGLTRWVRDRAFPVVDATGTVVRVTGLAEDITQRKELENQLQQKYAELEAAHTALQESTNEVELGRARYQELFESAPDAYLVSDLHGVVLEVNGAAESLFNCERTKLYGFPLSAFVSPPDRAKFLAELNALVKVGGQPIARWEMNIQFQSAVSLPVNVTVVARPDTIHGNTTLWWLMRDITRQKKAAEALQQSEERFRQVAEIVGDFIWEVDATGLYTYTSPSVEGILRYRPDELVGKMHFYDLFTPETREELKKSVFKVFAERKSFRSFSNPNVSKEGTIVHLETSGVPILDSTGNLQGYRGANTDITERKKAEAALHRSWAEIQQLKDRLQAESEYLQTEIKVTESFGEIMGQSQAIKRVLHQIEQVAPADCPVLIQGETGTGKELIARAIHRISPRGKRVMIKVNAAALPSALVESELFGREKGAFTGALTSQAGRFEVADGSTIFLDEVGELSLEVQAKLLRVLQEGEFERLGSPKVHKVDVRVIAASNRDLAEEVRLGRFRQDLFYRLSVFPIRVPPLRERAEDIPVLVSAFVAEFSSRMGKKITKLPRRTMEMLQRYSWPGNIRELRNVLEHGVILSADEVLRVAILSDSPQAVPAAKTLAESEREHILKVFEKTHGRVKGPNGAAELLGINPGTLYSRMRKLGIPKPRARG